MSSSLPAFERPLLARLAERLHEPRAFIQVLAGPRQVGKTTLARQAAAALGTPAHYASADEAVGFDRGWLAAQWQLGRERAREGEALLILDEVQKVPGWSDLVKLRWDEDGAAGLPLKVVLLGSAPLLVQRGLTESLAGRFEQIRVPHWSFGEMRAAFGWGLERFVYFGGYPGAAVLADDEERWRSYILDSLVETAISRDVQLLSPVHKPALMRQLFRLGCEYSGQILSYTKMLGQLHDAGNTTTLAHYLELLSGAGMVSGLQKYSGSKVRQRGSSPKLLVHNTALMSAVSRVPLREARADADLWGRLVESAVGAHLLAGDTAPWYWRESNREVDFLVHRGRVLTAIEVTSGRRKPALAGLDAFVRRYAGARPLLVGGQGVPLDEFLAEPPDRWVTAGMP